MAGTRVPHPIKNRATDRRITHDRHASPEYKSWVNMHQRCDNPKHRDYHRYGGRGIRVCEAWRDFAKFYADMGQRMHGTISLDRIDNDGQYEHANCRWATRKQQQRNMRSNRVITFNGLTMTLAAWAEKIGITDDSLGRRLKKHWSIERALTTPFVPREKRSLKRP